MGGSGTGEIYSYASDGLRGKPVSSHGASSKFKLSGAAGDVNPRSDRASAALPCGLFHGVGIRLLDVHRDPRDWTDLVRFTPCAVFLKNRTISCSLNRLGKCTPPVFVHPDPRQQGRLWPPSSSGNGKPRRTVDARCSGLTRMASPNFLDLADNPRPQLPPRAMAYSLPGSLG
jgi:hypothetical protein